MHDETLGCWTTFQLNDSHANEEGGWCDKWLRDLLQRPDFRQEYCYITGFVAPGNDTKCHES